MRTKLKYLTCLVLILLTSCNSIGIMLDTRAYYPVITDMSYQERSKNGQSWVRIKKTRTDSSIYIRNPELIGFSSSGFESQKLDSLKKEYNLEESGYYKGITLLRKINGNNFDKYNSPELLSLRESKSVFDAGAVATVDSKKKIFLTRIYVYLEKDYVHQEYQMLLKEYMLKEKNSYLLNGYLIKSLTPQLNIGEGIVELAMELQRNKNIKHAIVETNPSPSNPLSE